MTYPEFEARWKNSGGAERANYGLFLQDLCDLLGVPRPDATTDNPAQDAYVLERAVTFDDGAGKKSTGRIDLYKRGCFVLETKQGTDTPDVLAQAERAQLGLPPERRRKGHAVRNTGKWRQMMEAARQQALGYVRALPTTEPRPLFVIVADVGYALDLYSNFAGVGDSFVPFPDSQRFRLPLASLANEETRAMLRLLFTDPRELDPSRRAAQVTRKLAAQLAALSAQLEQADHASDVVAQFLMRCLFTMFAEDTGLIPKQSFTGLLEQYDTDERRQYLPDVLTSLWTTMDAGGFSPSLVARIPRFNGQLFHNAAALPLSVAQVTLLRQAAAADWTTVEPAIFGTLLERALDPKERHRLGAHYTPRRYVERLVLPTVIEPLRREWAAAQAASARRQDEGNLNAARNELVKFQRRLTTVKVLDPACGTGNFLYVTLEHLKRLEGEVLDAINGFGQTGLLDLAGGTTVGPRQLLGLELNPRAAAIADVVLRIGYLQWHIRTHGLTQMPEPLLTDDHNIQQQDAALQHGPPTPRLDAQGNPVTRWDGTTRPHPVTGLAVPDETARAVVLEYPNPRPAEWPTADFIIGNPPFIGPARMREALGDGYTEALRFAYRNQVPDSADFVMYWWHHAAQTVQAGTAARFGFITTNSIKQTFNRRVMQPFLEGDKPPLSLTFAIADHPWVDSTDGAAVRIAITVAETNPNVVGLGQLLTLKTETAAEDDDASDVTFTEQQGQILSDLTIGVNLDSTKPLKANEGLSNRGVMPFGLGFTISQNLALSLGLGETDTLQEYIKPYRNGKDLTATTRGVYIIDFFGLSADEVLIKFPKVYQYLLEHVKPERDANRDKAIRENWWLHGRTRSSFRPALSGLSRYIVSPRVAKHRFFLFLEKNIVPDDKLNVFAFDDAYQLGVLSSKIHVTWALATGGRLGVGNDPVYDGSRCFQPFPFPDATSAQQARIRELAETLDAHRKRQQAAHPTLTLTNLYNVVEKLRAGQPLNAKEQTTNQQGLASVLLSLHNDLDAAVADAYGWPVDLPEAELLARLVQLNHARAAEEAAGTVRYLRPAYQAPGQQQSALTLGTTATAATAVAETAPQPWPTELAQQMQAVRAVVTQAGVPLTPKQVAARFKKAKPAQVQPMLATLTALSLLRHLEPEDAYAA
ncbi:class I SAM-dependent DNA methyltransferase [Hymenobacter aerilatus]|uniref:site-specific DNA-methyltransferase (adenine-specific) n=1 Tax=Hymenobacter aerilatus TaxID=2932251 RepID=A0A8T9SNM9_9BACT|nr:DNA methyltransferase [Hymenobacter aerilatus]UOR03728.1 class I SAM-dependent DNA methyltransferase [Hymenobacter aerilatus]